MADPSPHNTYARPQAAEAGPEGGEMSVEMSMLGDLLETQARGQFGDEEPVGLGLPEDEEPRLEREASTDEEDPPKEGQDVESLREELRQLRESMSRPAQGISPDDLSRSFAQALHWSRQMDRQPQQTGPPEPPSFFDGSLDLLSEDPEKLGKTLDGATRKAAQWGYERALEAVRGAWGQQNQGLSQIQGFIQSVAPAMEEMARERAESFGSASGYFADDKHKGEVMQRAEQLLAAQQDQTLRYKPDGWRAALQYLAANDPKLVKGKPKAPPSAGDGDLNTSPSKGGTRADNHPAVRMAAQLAGRRPTADEIAKFEGMLR